jgi:hypothetical protein
MSKNKCWSQEKITTDSPLIQAVCQNYGMYNEKKLLNLVKKEGKKRK